MYYKNIIFIFASFIGLAGTNVFARGSGHSSYTAAHSYTHSYVKSGKIYSKINTNVHYTKSYNRKDGTPVSSYHARNPDGTERNNFSALGNINPYNLRVGTKPAYK